MRGGKENNSSTNLYDSSWFGSLIETPKYASAKTLIRSLTICKDTAGEDPIYVYLHMYT